MGPPQPQDVPRPPPYAWDWLQRSRPVLQALADRLTGRPGTHGFVDDVRAAFDDDPFVRAVVIDTIADVAFSGRVPDRRPAGVTWDRGLSWWAATLAGTTRREFETGGRDRPRQPDLFGQESVGPGPGRPSPDAGGHVGGRVAPRRSAVATLERRRLAEALRALLERSAGDSVPAGAIRQLIHDLESLD